MYRNLNKLKFWEMIVSLISESVVGDLTLMWRICAGVCYVGTCIHSWKPHQLGEHEMEFRNAWKQLGDMDPEVAMEQYVTVLLRIVPGCNQDEVSGDSKHIFADADACRKLASDLNTWKKNQLAAVDERIKDELIPCHEGLDVNGSSIESP
ncbi:hypothetical protein Patl1_28562 [Pistacia atlantica]|uniref:Uncharacterized protein n=1 Tax=Pistacia atlantica TaxID=434234 RepID=A0ACC1BGZ8_9ROSI|nr:hypothetical protein Patl1_28562 [Pistacia atlantica]